MNTRHLQFEELPLIITGGYEAGQVNGTAAISYRRDGEWNIDGIWLDGFKKPGTEGKYCKPVELDHGTPIFLAIYDRLEHEWRDRVEDFVQQMIQEDRETAAEDYADFKRGFVQAAE